MSRTLKSLVDRDVFRVAAAYVAVSWVILQVIDVLRSFIPIPDWVGQLTITAVAVGFPIALFLSWTYRWTEQGELERESEGEIDVAEKFGGRKIDFLIIGALSLVIVLLVIERPPRIEPERVVTKYTPLAKSQVFLPPFPSKYPLAHDGSRIYFNDFIGGRIRVSQMSITGGKVTPFAPAIDGSVYMVVSDMTQDRSTMYVDSGRMVGKKMVNELWAVPVVGGSPRRLLEDGRGGFLSPDEQQFVFSRNSGELYVHNIQTDTSKHLATVGARIYWPRFSPDGKSVQFSHCIDDFSCELYTVSSEGGEPEPLLPNFQADSTCCGTWSPDGKHFVFEARHDDDIQLWAVTDARSGSLSNATPFQITQGNIHYKRPLFSDDGNTIFAAGWQLRGELVRYNEFADAFIPIPEFESMSFDQLEYSRKGDRVLMVSYPDSKLWISDPERKSARQLVFDIDEVSSAHWSPDGTQIAFEGSQYGGKQGVYLIAPDGGPPTRISDDDSYASFPQWSSDGAFISYNQAGQARPTIYDVAGGTSHELPGDGVLLAVKWSPDGSFGAGWSAGNLVLYDVSNSSTLILVSQMPYQDWFWAADSKHLYVIDSFVLEAKQSIHKLSIDDSSQIELANIGKERIVWGTSGRHVSVTPDGIPIFLRDIGIHNIYALSWPQP